MIKIASIAALLIGGCTLLAATISLATSSSLEFFLRGDVIHGWLLFAIALRIALK